MANYHTPGTSGNATSPHDLLLHARTHLVEASAEARAEQPPPADLQKTETKPLIPVRQIELTRPAPAPDPKPPVTADAPAKMPPVLIAQEEGSRERYDDICSRHHLQKVYTRGGRSWRCR